jgi:hypothetical protein
LLRTDLLLRGHLIPGEHDVEQVVVDAYQLHVGDRFGRNEHATLAQRAARFDRAADDHLRDALAIGERQFAAHQINRLARDRAQTKRIQAAADGFDEA